MRKAGSSDTNSSGYLEKRQIDSSLKSIFTP